MGNELEALVAKLVCEGDSILPQQQLNATEVIESDSEEAWNDFQDSQMAYEKAFVESQQGPI
jgi:hypothetical protein